LIENELDVDKTLDITDFVDIDMLSFVDIFIGLSQTVFL